MWERNNINIRFLWGSLPRPMSSHMRSARVCVCVCTQKEALSWEQLPLQWVPHLSVWFQLQSLQMQLTAFVTVMLWRLARHMKLEVAAESGWSGALHSRTETTVGLVVTVVQFFYMIFFKNKTAGWGQGLLQSLDIWEENYQQRALLVVSTDWTFKIREVN